jgi:hypothetical protein
MFYSTSKSYYFPKRINVEIRPFKEVTSAVILDPAWFPKGTSRDIDSLNIDPNGSNVCCSIIILKKVRLDELSAVSNRNRLSIVAKRVCHLEY